LSRQGFPSTKQRTASEAPADLTRHQSGTVTFAPGQTQATVSVTVLADPQATADLSFFVDLGNPVNAVLGGNVVGKGTIHVGG
jgi:hypothetical protein